MNSPQTVALAIVVALAGSAASARAQHDMSHMAGASMPSGPLGLPLSRLGSATSWLPDSSPMHAAHRGLGDWTLMLHGAAFGQYDHQASSRAADQLGLIDWEMLMALRPLAGGLFRVNAMTSAEPFVLGARGYPELLQTGGVFDRLRLVDHEHPHDVVTELAAAFDHAIMSNVAMSLYVAPVGEPALGPVGSMHRPSAENDPFAPIGEHWEDANHGNSGVVTAGVYGRMVKLEGSIFNARESADNRSTPDFRGAKLDSYAGRLSAAPNGNVTVAAWVGYVYAHDPLDDPMGMQRYGASILTVSRGIGGGAWANGIVWGLNVHHHSSRLHTHEPGSPTYNLSAAALIESSLDVGQHSSIYGRVEQVQKSSDDLGFLAGEPTQQFTIREASLGATHDVRSFGDASLAVGVRGTVNVLPASLAPAYHTRTPSGFDLYVRIRPRAMR